jgi:hypothetical protein
MKKYLFFILLISIFVSYINAQENNATKRSIESPVLGKIEIDKEGNVKLLENYTIKANVDSKTKIEESIGATTVSKESLSNTVSRKSLKTKSEIANKSNLSINSEVLLYAEMLKRQKNPLLDAHEELYNINGIIWQRRLGEKEYFIAPCKTKNEIMDTDSINRSIKTKLTEYFFVKVDPSLISTSANLSLMRNGIIIPYYVNDSLIIMLPKTKMEELNKCNAINEILLNYGKKQINIIKNNKTKSTIWTEDFEGSIPGSSYSVGDANSTSGEDYWDDLSCYSHNGTWSLWCADVGDMTDCSNYDNDMSSYFINSSPINVGGYSNVQLKYWISYDTETGYDNLKEYYSSNGSNYYLSTTFEGSSNGWVQRTVSLTSFTNYYFEFDFYSDGSFNNYDGVYIDDMEITGTSSGLPNLSRVSGYSSLSVNGTYIDFSVRIENNGTASAGSSYVGYYLSTDISITTGDYFLDDDYVSSLSPGSYSDETYSIDVGLMAPPGTYFFHYRIDDYTAVQESDEYDNNWYFSSPQVTIAVAEPNLTIVSGYSSLSINFTTVDLSLRVENNGSSTASSSYVGYYLSPDLSFNTIYKFGQDYVQSLNPGEYSNESINQDVTNNSYSSIPCGNSYYVYFKIDDGNAISESDESDNNYYFSSSQVLIDDPSQPDPIIGTSTPCSGISYDYYILPVSGATSYAWTYSGSGTPNNNGTNCSLSPTSNGSLCVTAHNSCGSSLQRCISITVDQPPSQPQIIGNTQVCQDINVTYNINPTNGTTYSWEAPSDWSPSSGTGTSFTTTIGSNSGNVTATPSNSCGTGLSGSQNVSVIALPLSPTGVSATDGIYDNKVRIIWNPVSGATSYDVKRGSTTICSNTADTVCEDYSASGTSTQYCVYAINDCGQSSASCDNGYTPVEELSSTEKFYVFPNPTSEQFTIQIETSKATDMQLKLFNIFGQLLYKDKCGTVSGFYEKNVSVSNFPAGIYTLQLSSEECIASRMIVVEK